MTIHDLNREQLAELKQAYIMEQNSADGVSYNELACADELVTDAEIFAFFGDCEFSEDDFSCSAGMNDDCAEVA